MVVFECQRDSYKKEFKTVVKSCEPSALTEISNREQQKTYNVFLEDTILFPEGGGQPDDRGTIGDVPVLRISRIGDKACHLTASPIEEGSEVLLKVDWDRRFDHMQQHSGQHLITAIIDSTYQYSTLSWNLGEKISFIELNTSSISKEQIHKAEQIINEKINNCTSVITTIYDDVDDPALKNARTRGLPEDHKGQVRIVTIEGIESNMCCGTHVKNLNHLQVVKLLYAEKMKKGKTNLYFVVGNRVLKSFDLCIERERNMMSLMRSNADELYGLVDKLQKSLKVTQKNFTSVMRDLASLEAIKFLSIHPPPSRLFMHRRDVEAEFMTRLVNEIASKIKGVTFFLSIGEDRGPGQVLLVGSKQLVDEVSPVLCETLGGKGFTKNGRFQGKVSNLTKRNVIENMILERLDN